LLTVFNSRKPCLIVQSKWPLQSECDRIVLMLLGLGIK